MPTFTRTRLVPGLMLASLLLAAACSTPPARATSRADAATADQVERGRYLVTVGGCHDCHTPKIMTAQGPVLDTTRLLSGHRSSEPIPAVPTGVIGPWGAVTNNSLTAWAGPWGVSYTANLTPDATGLGAWTPEIFIATLRTGKHMGVGRAILPPMPWFNYAEMNDQDLRAVFAYLRSLPPVENRVPMPVFAAKS